MNKYLLMSAAAAMATGVAGSANAAGYSVHFLGAYGTSYCDGYIGGTHSGTAGGQHYFQVCASLGDTWLRNIQVVGAKAKNKTTIKGYYFSDTTYAMSLSDLGYGPTTAYSEAIEFALAGPAAGKSWALWVSFGGTSAFEGNHGSLAAGQYAKVHGRTAQGKGQASTKVIADIIKKALKAAPHKHA